MFSGDRLSDLRGPAPREIRSRMCTQPRAQGFVRLAEALMRQLRRALRRTPAETYLSSSVRGAIRNPFHDTQRRPHRSIPRIPKSRRFDVSRDEFNRVIDLLNTRGEILQEYRSSLDQMRRDLDIQFKRIAQLQLELDQIRNRF